MRTADTSFKIEKIDRIIDNNFDQPEFGIDNICRELGVSRSQLYRQVKEYTQLSISLYIRKRKMIKAAELLRSSPMKTSEISYLLGIDSPQSFSKYFAQEFGASPTAYRRQRDEESANTPEEKATIVTFIAPPDNPPPDNTPSEDISPRKRTAGVSRQIRLSALFLLLLLMASCVAFWMQTQEVTPSAEPDTALFENSIAVMPFKNLGPEKTDYLCVGVRDQIHGSLALIDKLKVISTSSTDRYKNTHTPVDSIARELGVNYLLEGSVLVVDQQLRIRVELVSAVDHSTVWTNSYDGQMPAVFDLLNQVAKEVSLELNQKLSDNFERQKNKKTTHSLIAYNEYLKGRQLILTRKKEQLLASVVHLKRAVQADPRFSDAFAQLSVAYHLMAENGVIPRDSSVKLGEQYALTAIRLDPNCGMAFAALANLYREQQKWDQAEAAYRIALRHQPNDAMINYWFSLLLRIKGNVDEAMRYSMKATALDPLHPVIHAGNVLNCLYANQTELAQKCIDDGKDLFNETFAYHLACTTFYTARHDYKRALLHAHETERLNPGVRMGTQIVFLKARDGRTDEVLTYLKALPETPENDAARAVIYSGLNDKEKSIHYLLKATSHGRILGDIKVSPVFEIMRDDPRYLATLKKFGL
ncbi:helix-turn-helix domain-containing protein [Dyadobacter sp. 32]|uniref:helix-turn-helix domain-containing protein n=1 Tax=Dyadobacter sp. 32 TaxID=538966 RepID=UPI0011EF085B